MPETLIEYYRAIEAASMQMLAAARQENWNQVVRVEGACAVLIEQLRHCAQTQDLTPEERRAKTRIMQQILRNDAELRVLAEPWLGELDKILQPRMDQLLH